MNQKTHFGNKTVDSNEKQNLVNEVFHKTSGNYDLMNDIMSFGIHRHWKEKAIQNLRVTNNLTICDIAAGSGDLTKLILEKNTNSSVLMTDINSSMLNTGYNRILNECCNSMQVLPTIANAEQLPFCEKKFDRIICGFGIRNMTNMDQALKEFFRCLKPGGRLVVLEFSHIKSDPINKIYQIYSKNIIPNLGAIVANDKDSYQYLVESIAKHPNQADFASMIRNAGFSEVAWENLSFGAVAIHSGIKL